MTSLQDALVDANQAIGRLDGVTPALADLFGTETLREAALLTIPESRVADDLRVELYQRLNAFDLQGLDVPKAAAFAVTAGRTFTKRVNTDLNYAKIDSDYTVYIDSRFFHALAFGLNGDSYGLGERVFTHASVKLLPSVTAVGFYTHAMGPDVMTLNQQGFSAGLNFDLKACANSKRPVF